MNKIIITLILTLLILFGIYYLYNQWSARPTEPDQIKTQQIGDLKDSEKKEVKVPEAQVVFECKLHLSKGPCWDPYEVKINLIDYGTRQQLNSFTLKKDKSYLEPMEITFNCKPNQLITYSASFTPAIWQGDLDKIFQGKNIISVPGAVPKDTQYITLNVCFSSDFAGVPEPVTQEKISCDCAE